MGNKRHCLSEFLLAAQLKVGGPVVFAASASYEAPFNVKAEKLIGQRYET